MIITYKKVIMLFFIVVLGFGASKKFYADKINVRGEIFQAASQNKVKEIQKIFVKDFSNIYKKGDFKEKREKEFEVISNKVNLSYYYWTKEGIVNLLNIACKNNNIEMVIFLLPYCKKETINYSDKRVLTPLFYALKNRNSKEAEKALIIIKLLIKEDGIDVNKACKFDGVLLTPLCYACKNKDLEIVKLLIEKDDIDVNKACSLDDTILTPLCYACKNKDFITTRLLLKKDGIDVNKASKYGFTPLYWAAKNNNIEIIKLLLENGAKMDCKSKAIIEKNKRLKRLLFVS